MIDHISLRTDFILYGLHPHYSYSITIAAVTVSPGPPTSPLVITTDEDGKTPQRTFKQPVYLCRE